MALLEVRDLRVSFRTDDGVVRAVQGMSFDVQAGRTLGLVGESGAGKSVSAQAILGLTPGAEISGRATFDGTDLLSLSERQLERIRGKRIAMIFQDPLTSLHPYYRVGRQISEAIEAHEDVSRKEAAARAVEMLGRVGIPEPAQRARDYPYQFSGGMRQRAMIAMALALRPEIIIADEPTTALDVTVQAQILELLAGLRDEAGTAIVLITHDLAVVAEMADEVVIMYAGRPMESAGVAAAFSEPHHPYTKGLLRSIPAFATREARLHPIRGNPPSLLREITACPFVPRCPDAHPECLVEPPPLKPVGRAPGHLSACVLPADRVGVDADSAAGAPVP